MANKSIQIAEGLVVCNWRVVSEMPKRNTKGVLEWACACPEGHRVQIAHHDLTYGAAPTICTACAQQAAAQRANDRAGEHRLEAEFRNMQRLAQQAQIVQQQEGEQPSAV
jgi:hypothetical protein